MPSVDMSTYSPMYLSIWDCTDMPVLVVPLSAQATIYHTFGITMILYYTFPSTYIVHYKH